MKVKVLVCEEKEIEVNDPVFEEIIEIHKDPCGMAGAERYGKALEIVEKITGISVDDSFGDNLGIPFITGCYTLDDEPIFEL